jgi:hypothetical protein
MACCQTTQSIVDKRYQTFFRFRVTAGPFAQQTADFARVCHRGQFNKNIQIKQLRGAEPGEDCLENFFSQP